MRSESFKIKNEPNISPEGKTALNISYAKLFGYRFVRAKDEPVETVRTNDGRGGVAPLGNTINRIKSNQLLLKCRCLQEVRTVAQIALAGPSVGLLRRRPIRHNSVA